MLGYHVLNQYSLHFSNVNLSLELCDLGSAVPHQQVNLHVLSGAFRTFDKPTDLLVDFSDLLILYSYN
jgi:hypothetical protein